MNVIEVLDHFPKISETFILREILAMQKKDIDIQVFAFSNPHEDIVHHEVKEVHKVTYFLKTRISQKIFAHLFWFVHSPSHYIKTALFAMNPNHGIRQLFLRNLHEVVLISNQKPDHIHAHWSKSTDFALLVFLLTDIPFTFTTHRIEIYDQPSKNIKIKSELAKKHITVTEDNKRYLINHFKIDINDIAVVHSAIDFTKNYPVADSKGKNTILTIARLEKIKGLDVLIRACSILKEDNYIFQCQIIGDGSERDNLIGMIKKLNLTRDVILTGNKTQKEVIELLAGAKLLVLPSRSEAWPNVFTEAMACRVPIIGTNVRGIPEIIEDGVNGFLVNPDNVDMLVEKIKILITNESLRRKFIEGGYQKAFEQFNLDTESSKLLDIWKS